MEGSTLGQILHGSATTTEAIRRAIHNSEESLRALSKRYGINQKTVAKWKKRISLADLPTGPKDPHSTILSLEALTDGSGAAIAEVASRLGVHVPDISRILPMALLSPKLTEAILRGQQPTDLTIARLTRMLEFPVSWKEQHRLLNV